MVQTVQNRGVSACVLGQGCLARCCKTVKFPPVFLDLVLCPSLCNDRCVVEAVQKTAEFPQWQYVDKVVDVPVVLLVVSSSRTKLLTCRCYADKVLIETVQKTVESPQLVLLLDMVVDVPVLVTSWGCRGSAVAVHRQVCQLIMAMMSS